MPTAANEPSLAFLLPTLHGRNVRGRTGKAQPVRRGPEVEHEHEHEHVHVHVFEEDQNWPFMPKEGRMGRPVTSVRSVKS